MAASAHLLLSALSKREPESSVQPEGALLFERAHVCLLGAEGACAEVPLTSEPPLPDAEPLTSEPPLADAAHLTSEPTSTGAASGV
ncbi:hypothetical protein [Streptomyces sp. NPDC048309]|uniref:hypothetical protein n=1 Tax=Streptomyces sp. NPDC048309 TaxID=3154618 RepID=UPI00340B564A